MTSLLIAQSPREGYPKASELLQTYDVVVIELFKASQDSVPISHIITKSPGLALALSKLPFCGLVNQGKELITISAWLDAEGAIELLQEYVSTEEIQPLVSEIPELLETQSPEIQDISTNV